MKVIIFGATGSVGRKIVTQALDEGHAVTAFVRNPAKFNLNHPNLRLAQGDVLDQNSVDAAINGHEAVLCAIGAGRKGTVRAQGTANIIQAMNKHGVRRLICQSTLGAGDSAADLNFFWKYLMFGLLLRPAFADHQLQEQYIKDSNLDWTIVRPAALTDGPATHNYLHGFAHGQKKLALKISRADVADFMLEQLRNTRYLLQTPGLSY